MEKQICPKELELQFPFNGVSLIFGNSLAEGKWLSNTEVALFLSTQVTWSRDSRRSFQFALLLVQCLRGKSEVCQ